MGTIHKKSEVILSLKQLRSRRTLYNKKLGCTD
jgi:hypothetical protein